MKKNQVFRQAFLVCVFWGSVAAAFADASQAAAAFGDARWLWPNELGVLTNAVVEFESRFSAARASELKLAIAADTVYSVSLNGSDWKIGRFPNMPGLEFYEVIEGFAAAKGDNLLRLRLYVQGRDSFQYIPGRQGLVFRLWGDGVEVTSNDGVTWRKSAKDRSDNVILVTPQLGYSFDYDAAAKENEWKRSGPRDLGLAAQELPLVKLPIAQCAQLPEVEERIVAQGILDGSSLQANPAKGMDATMMKPVVASEFFELDGRTVKPRWFKDGFYVLVDLGREECGLLSLDIDTDAGAIIDIGHAEHMENGRIAVALKSYFFAGRYRAAEGKNVYCRWSRRMAGRYIQLHVRGVANRFKLNRLTVKPMEFQVEEKPLPDFATGVVGDIWRTSVRTLKLCMHEHYEDCPWREQAMYGNDSRNQMLAGYFAFAESNRMPEHCLRLLARGVGEDGWISLCVPSRRGRPIPSFTFSWVLSVDDYLKYRKNIQVVKELLPTVKLVLSKRSQELKNGLLPCPKAPRRYWQFYDWVKDLDNEYLGEWQGERYDAPLNLFCIMAFDAGVRLAEAAGDVKAAAGWRDTADAMRRKVRLAFWNESKCQVETSLDEKLHPAELVQSLALLTDVVPAEHRHAVVKKLSAPSQWTETSLSQSVYKYEALCAEGGEVSRKAIRSMTAVWKGMLDAGATSFWEVKEGRTAFNGLASLCHGWSAIPIYLYMKADE